MFATIFGGTRFLAHESGNPFPHEFHQQNRSLALAAFKGEWMRLRRLLIHLPRFCFAPDTGSRLF
jgi:hypothetical protein